MRNDRSSRLHESCLTAPTNDGERRHDDASNEYVTWRTDIGFVEPWDAQFYVILGQAGFFDEFAVTTSRRLLTVVVEDPEELHRRRPNL